MCFLQPGSADRMSTGRAWCDRSVSGAVPQQRELSPLAGSPEAGEGGTKTTARPSQGRFCTDTRVPCSQGVGGTVMSLARAASPAAQPWGFAVAQGQAEPSLLFQQRAGAAARRQWWRRSASVRLHARPLSGRAVTGAAPPLPGAPSSALVGTVQERQQQPQNRRGTARPGSAGHPGRHGPEGPQHRGALRAAPGCAALRARCWEPSNLNTRAGGLKLCDMLFVCK